MQRLPSLELVALTLKHEREIQLRHFEALDGKSGILLGFAGALVALIGARDVLATAARVSAAGAALLSLWSFIPRGYPFLEAFALRALYLRADVSFTQMHLVDTHVAMIQEGARILSAKAFRLRLGVSFTGCGHLFDCGQYA